LSSSVPAQARVVIIGGGVIGCSVAYHLTKLGWTDVLLLEQGQLSCGTTWHAAGLVGQLRSEEALTQLIRYSAQLYGELEAETGCATGWRNCGSLSVARTPERMTQLKRTAALARAYGVACEVVSAREAGELWPLMRTEGLEGAVWLPGDGKVNPSDLTQAFAHGARNAGARILERVRVTGISIVNGTACGVSWHTQEGAQGSVACEIIVNCAGQWAKALGSSCGVTVPLHSAEHYYIVTERIAGIEPRLPVLRDPDGFVYFKEEVGGLLMGGFEPNAKPWGMQGIPQDFEFQLLPEDWDQFAILMENALQRVPALANAGVKQFCNGPESFTPDGNFLLGAAPELRNFYVAAAFNSAGIASAGGAGRALAEWISAGEPTMDLWAVDIRRFARFHGNDLWLQQRVKETLGLHYAMHWPNRELASARPLRRSPLHALLDARGASFGSKMGWERANWFAPAGTARELRYSFEQPHWSAFSALEHQAARAAVALFDLSSFAKFIVKGSDAEQVLQHLMSNDVAVATGRTVYSAMLNERGGFESDLTLTRVAGDEYLVVSGSAQATRDRDYIERRIPAQRRCSIVEVTGMYAVLAVMGPRSRALLARVSRADFDNAAFPFGSSREVDIGYATVRATRRSYVGELGWELYVPVEQAICVYETLYEAGKPLGLLDAGYYALESLRLEKGYRAWGRELTPDRTPLEAGLGFAVKLHTPIAFRGREALLQQRAQEPQSRLVIVTLEDPAAMLWGGELIVRDGKAVGHLTSGAYGHTLGRAVGMGYVRDEGRPISATFIEQGRYEIDVGGAMKRARAQLRAPYDPSSERVKA